MEVCFEKGDKVILRSYMDFIPRTGEAIEIDGECMMVDDVLWYHDGAWQVVVRIS